MIRRVAWWVSAAVLVGATSARAQGAPGSAAPPGSAGQPGSSASPAPADDPARQAFARGLEALGNEHYPEALAAFEDSYRVRRVASVALNLGITLRALGRLVEARGRFLEFRAMATPAQHAEYDAAVAEHLADIARRVGAIHVADLAPASTTLSVDGREVTPDAAGDVAVDPGTHALVGEASGYASYRGEVRVAGGARADVRVVLVAVAALGASDPGQGSRAAPGGARRVAARPFYAEPWFWVATVLLVGGAVTAAVAITASGTDPLPPTNTGVTVQTALRWSGP